MKIRIMLAASAAVLLAFLGAGAAVAAPAPALPAPTATSQDADVDTSQDVIVTTPGVGKDGKPVTTVAEYTAADGVTSDELIEKLRPTVPHGSTITTEADAEHGPDATTPRTLVPSNACADGTARALCGGGSDPVHPNLHWANEGYSHPQVRFNDHSGANWPTDAAVAKWNQAQGIDSHYLYNNCPFQAGARCVDVQSANYGATGWTGYTTYTYDSAYNFTDNNTLTRLNDYYPHGSTGQTYRSVVQHELGHALGLGHNVSTTSCMYAPSQTDLPNTDDFDMLASIYSVQH